MTTGPDPVLFDAVLHPHRSLGRKGFAVFMTLLGVASAILGAAFVLMGAWPVIGFFGLDVLLVWLAFRRNFKDARICETVRLTTRRLTVAKIGLKGPPRTWTFQPYWLRVRMDDPPEHDSQVVLSSHGRSLVVGSFLSPEERLDFARALGRALDRLKGG
ncbi:MAG TPA: DUF2244 domain-containing protein [Azospirillaceae bacterium]|nr:DUF2244 domain-containing protein [Azospirillaceae bacterium]